MNEPGEILERVPAGDGRDAFLPLFRLADDSESALRSYYQQGELFALRDGHGALLAMALAIPETDGAVELKAVAVVPQLQGRGVGKRLLALVLDALRRSGARRVVVATGNSSIDELAFYQKAGFRLRRVERDFFNPERGYPPGLVENGIPLRDRVWLDQDL